MTYLWDQVRELRAQLLEAQLQNAVIEAEVREEVVQETQETLEEMKRAYDQRLAIEVGSLLVCKRLNDAEDVFLFRTLHRSRRWRRRRMSRSK